MTVYAMIYFKFVFMSAMISYISDLLYRHECVVVPEFGAFVTRRIPAYIDQDTAEIRPPSKNIIFNPRITETDGLLSSYVSDREGISYIMAKRVIERFVVEQKNILTETGTINWARIGRFTEENGEFSYEQARILNHLPEAYGLSTMRVSPWEDKQVVDLGERNTDVGDVHHRRIGSTDNSYKSSRGWLKYAAIGLIAVGVSSYFGYTGYQDDRAAHNLAVEQLVEEKLKEKITAETIAVASPLPKLEVRSKPIIAEPEVLNYHLVAGAFRDGANADKKVRQLKNEGYAASRIGTNRYGLHTVAIGSYATKDAATVALNDIRKGRYKGVWLLVSDSQ